MGQKGEDGSTTLAGCSADKRSPGMPGVLVDFSMFLKEKGWYFAKSLFDEGSRLDCHADLRDTRVAWLNGWLRTGV